MTSSHDDMPVPRSIVDRWLRRALPRLDDYQEHQRCTLESSPTSVDRRVSSHESRVFFDENTYMSAASHDSGESDLGLWPQQLQRKYTKQ